MQKFKFYAFGLKTGSREVDKNRKAGEKEVKKPKTKWGGIMNK